MSTQIADPITSSLAESDVIQTSLREAEKDVDLCACGKNLNDHQTVTLYKNIDLREETLADQIVETVMDTTPSSTVTPTPRREHVSEKRVYHLDDVVAAFDATITDFSVDSYENFFTYDEQYELCLSCAIDAGVDIEPDTTQNIQMNTLNSRQNNIQSHNSQESNLSPDSVVNAYTAVVFIGVLALIIAGTVVQTPLLLYLAIAGICVLSMSVTMKLWHTIATTGDDNE